MSHSRRTFLLGTVGMVVLSACSDDSAATGSSGDSASGASSKELSISAIPDQDPELLNRLYGLVAEAMGSATGLTVAYQAVTDYTAVVRGFEVGDIQLAWMGGLTGVQARERVPGSQAIAQRDIDADFHSLFIANRSAGLEPFGDVSGLAGLAGTSLTFGSETSTSGRLMPQFFMDEAGLALDELSGPPGFSGSHDATIEAVASGAFQVGAVNEQVYAATEEAGEVDLSDVVVLFRTPGYADYHWLVRPDVDEVFGQGTTRELVPGATAIAQRDIDADFHSLFIANRSAGLEPFDDVSGLTALEGKTLTFGSETSTSGRLMPTYFMEQAGLAIEDLSGPPGFSGSHDATIEAVASGAFQVGAVNEQVYTATEEAGEVDLSDVVVLFRSPGYADYHWLVRPDVDDVFGEGTTQDLQDFLLGLDTGKEKDAQILELFGAESFIEAEDSAYDQLEEVARAQGLLR